MSAYLYQSHAKDLLELLASMPYDQSTTLEHGILETIDIDGIIPIDMDDPQCFAMLSYLISEDL